jgi:hypothetical protein
MQASIEDLNAVIKELNREGFAIYNNFRMKENEDFLGTFNDVLTKLFIFFVISSVAVYFTLNLNNENAR